MKQSPYVNSLALFYPPSFTAIGNMPRVPNQFKFNPAILKAFRSEMYGALNHIYFGTNGNNFNINPAYADRGISGNRTIQIGMTLYF